MATHHVRPSVPNLLTICKAISLPYFFMATQNMEAKGNRLTQEKGLIADHQSAAILKD